MIRAFNRLKDTWLFKIILILVIFSFISLWGVGSIATIFDPNNEAAVTMKGGEITGGEVVQEFEWETNKYRQMMPMGFSYQDALQMGLLQESLYNAIYNKVMEQIADNNDIFISKSIVFEYIRSNPEFMGENREFSRKVFLDILAQSALTEKEFIQIAGDDIVESYILDTNRAFPYAPKEMLELITKQRSSLRDAVVVSINVKDIKLPTKATEEELQGFYEENQDAFMTIENRDFSVAMITYDEIKKNINVSDEELREIFDTDKESLNTPETRYIYGLMFEEKDAAKADEAVKELKGGEKDFKRVAMEKAFQFENEWDWGYIAKDFIIEDLKEPVFTAKKGDVVGPLKTSDNRYYVVQITEIKPFVEATFKDKKDELLDRVKQERAEEVAFNLIEAIEEDVGINTPIAEIAEKHGMKLTSYKGKTADDKKVNQIMLGTVFSMEEGETSGVIDIEDGLLVAKINSVKFPSLKEFDQVKKEVVTMLETQQKEDAAEKLMQDVITKANADGIASAIKANNLKSRTIKDVKYGDEEHKELSKRDVDSLFMLQKGEAFVNPVAGGYMIVGLGRIKDSDKKMPITKQSEVKNSLEDSIIKSLEQQFYMDYANELEVKTNQDVIERTFKALLRSAEQ